MRHPGVAVRRVPRGEQPEGPPQQRQVVILHAHQPPRHVAQAPAQRLPLLRVQAQKIPGLLQIQLHGVQLAGLLVAAVAPGMAFAGEHGHGLAAGAGQRLRAVLPFKLHDAAPLDAAVDYQYALVIVQRRRGLRREMAEVGQVHQAADAVHVPRDDLAALFPGKPVDQRHSVPGRHANTPWYSRFRKIIKSYHNCF